MGLTLEQYQQRLADSGLLSKEALHSARSALGSEVKTPEELAKALIKAGKLTKFQAQQIAQGKGKSLKLDRYILKDKIGAGGMGQVYLAEHERMKRQVALKVLPTESLKNPDLVKRFHREVEAAAKLAHPNIVTAFDADEANGSHFLVMEYVPGQDLSSLIRQNGVVDIETALNFIQQTAEGLKYAHEQGIVHRDIKPANLLLDHSGTIKILDMGLARVEALGGDEAAEAQTGITQTGVVMGTVDYMAPEQAMDTRTADARSDIYSLGCTLFYLLTGQPMFREDTVMKKLMALQTQLPPSLREKRREVPPAVEDLYQRMVTKRAEDRFQSMADVLVAIKACHEEEPAHSGERTAFLSKDPALKQFLEGRKIASTPTLVAKATDLELDQVAVTKQETLPSAMVADTLTSPPSSSPLAKAKRRSTKKAVPLTRNPIAVGGAVAGLLLVTLLVLWSAGIIFKVETEHGTLVINVTGDNFATTVQGQTVTIRNTATEETVTITLDDVRTTQPDLETGEYEFVLESSSGLKTRSNRFEITGEGENVVEVWWEPMVADGGDATTTTVANTDGWHGWPADAPPPAIAPFDAVEAAAHQQAWADYLGVPVEWENSIGMKFRLIPPGEFMMGSTPEEIEAALEVAGDDLHWQELIRSESPQHIVILTQPVYVGVKEVTQSQYEQVMATNPSHFSAGGEGREAVADLETENHPVEVVSWNDAAEFCSKLSQQEQLNPYYFRSGETVTPLEGNGYRLPTEAEWESACRAGTTTRFWCGDQDNDLLGAGWFGGNSGVRTHAVGELRSNPFGLSDVHGNVWEWVQDSWDPSFYGQFSQDAAVDPSSPNSANSERILRGGDWNDIPSRCRSSDRHSIYLPYRNEFIGFRVALPVDAVRGATAASAQPVTDATDPYARDRAAAEWVLGKGGFVNIISGGEQIKDVAAIESLPAEDFVLTHVYVNDCRDVGEEIGCLAGLPGLETVNVGGSNVDAGLIHSLTNCPRLRYLHIFDTPIQTSQIVGLERQTVLHDLYVSADQIDDDWAFLLRLPYLRQIQVYGTEVPPALEQLAEYPNIQTLWLPDLETLDETLVSTVLAANPDLRIRVGPEGRVVGDDPARRAAAALLAEGLQIQGPGVAGNPWDSTEPGADLADLDEPAGVILPEGVLWNDVCRQQLAGLTRLPLTISTRAITGADSFVDELQAATTLYGIHVTRSDFTDEGLASISHLVGLSNLHVSGTNVTRAGIDEFKRHVPGCTVYSDFGIIPYEHRLPEGWGEPAAEPQQPQ